MKRNSPLRRKTALKRGGPLRPISEKKALAMKSASQRSKPIKDKSAYKFRQKKPMRKISKKKEKVMRTQYYPASKAFLALQENRFCAICICDSTGCTWEQFKAIMAREDADAVLASMGARISNATETHHRNGRAGRNLCDTRFFVPSCYFCRVPVHDRKGWAIEVGLICPPAEWNVPVPREEPEIIFEKTKIAA